VQKRVIRRHEAGIEVMPAEHALRHLDALLRGEQV
jgi:hypothetical protein